MIPNQAPATSRSKRPRGGGGSAPDCLEVDGQGGVSRGGSGSSSESGIDRSNSGFSSESPRRSLAAEWMGFSLPEGEPPRGCPLSQTARQPVVRSFGAFRRRKTQRQAVFHFFFKKKFLLKAPTAAFYWPFSG